MNRRTLVAALLLGLAAQTWGWAAAETTDVVQAVRIVNLGAGRVDEKLVSAHTSLKPGSEFSRIRLARDVRALLDTGFFSYVTAEAEPAEGGLCLVYSIRNKYRLSAPVEISGARHFKERKIRNWIGLEVGDLVDDQVLGVRAQRIRKEYREDYYPDATVTWRLDETDPRQALAKVTVRIEEGSRPRVGGTRFVGNTVFPTKVLLAAVKHQRVWWKPQTWWGKPKFNEDEFDAAQWAIRGLYGEKGYLEAKVLPYTTRRDEDGNLIVTTRIEEGPAYRFGRVSIEGVRIFPEEELRREIAVIPGVEASDRVIESSQSALHDYYGSRGYLNTSVEPVLDLEASSGIANVRFVIVEGELVSIRNIKIRGNTRTRDKVIRREFLVYPGEVFDEVKVRRSERRVDNLGFFSSVRSYPVTTPDEDQKDLVVEVEEKRTGQFMVGAGFSSIDKMIGYVELSQGNFDIAGWPYFTGGGQKLRMRAQVGSRRRDYELSFVEPWFLDRKLSLGFDLYRREVDYSDYDITRTGAAINLGKPLPGPHRIDFRYQFEQVVLEDIADTNQYVLLDSPTEPFYFHEERNALESSFKITLTHDTRDNPFFPNRGNRSRLFGRVSGGVFGFDTDTYGLGLESSQYLPLWFKHVLSFRARYEVVDSYGQTDDVPISDRLFIGGGRTLRGFDYREVGPKAVRYSTDPDRSGEVVHHRPVGGKSLGMLRAELAVPLVAKLNLVAFYDIGNVWSEMYVLELENLASSTGIGLRLDMPGFPIRIDRAWVLEKDDEFTGEDPWVIWIGYDY